MKPLKQRKVLVPFLALSASVLLQVQNVQATEAVIESTDTIHEEVLESSSTENESVPVNVLSGLPRAEVKPTSLDSNEIINVQPVWNKKLKGEGTIVAVIDSGLDVTHDVLRISNVATAKYKTKEEFEEAKLAAGIQYGKWYSDKVVFAYNYNDVSDEIKEESNPSSHGMHVSGIAVGNPSQPSLTGNLVPGVAPEAQLMFMRVFSSRRGPNTSDFLYSRAIDDAVKLGADTINLSLGGPNGSLMELGGALNAAIERARQAGITVVIAAGNEGAFGDGYGTPPATAPDSGLVGAPSVSRDAISVASINNGVIPANILNVVGMESNDALNNGNVIYNAATETKLDPEAEFDYVYVNLGQPEDFEGKNLEGKIALIKRGEITFEDKVKNALVANPAGVVIFNNVPDEGPMKMSLGEEEAVLNTFVVAVTSDIGEALAVESGKNKYKLRFPEKEILFDSPDAGKMSDFTSWGLSADGELKPDITAPGGNIFSSVNDGDYDVSSGTSMASPHVAGATAILKQALVAKNTPYSGAELQAHIKRLLMSTANPHIDSTTNAYTSPRRQGAGVLDLNKAVHSELYVTGTNGYPSINNYNVGEIFSFNVEVHNDSTSEKRLTYVTNLSTDEVAEGFMTLRPRQLEELLGSEIVVPAKGKVVVPITIDSSKYTEELSQLMPNGYFLEGFVRFLDATTKGDLVSIPFVGFKGKFEDLATIETPIYELPADKKAYYYEYESTDTTLDQYTKPGDKHFTGILTKEQYEGNESLSVALGTFENAEGRYVLTRDDNGKVILAISPNGDGHRDDATFRATFLRNARDIKLRVYAETDTNREHALWESSSYAYDKSYFGGGEAGEKSITFENAVFSGKDKDNNDLPSGNYKYVVTSYSAVPGSKEQVLEFDIIIDRDAPVVTTGNYDTTTRKFFARQPIEDGSGLYREQVFYVRLLTEEEMKEKNVTEGTTREYLQPNDDGSYTLPMTKADGTELKLEDFTLEYEDFAGNISTSTLDHFEKIGNNNGVVYINLVDAQTGGEHESGYRYTLRNEKGEVVTEDTKLKDANSSLHNLPFGKYTVDLVLFDTDITTPVGEITKAFELTEHDSVQVVSFEVTPTAYAATRVIFDTVVPSDSTVTFINELGGRFTVTPSNYSKQIYESYLPLGSYTVEVTLPNNHVVVGESTITVVGGQRNALTLSIGTVRTEKINFTTERIFDQTVAPGTERVTILGEEGIRTFTTVNGKEDAGIVTKAAVNKEIRFNDTKQRIETIQFETYRILSDKLLPGTEVVVQEGEDGLRTFTTSNGQEDSGVVTKPAVTKIVVYNDAPVVTTRTVEVPYETHRVFNEALAVGTETVVIQGVNGVRVITTTNGIDDEGKLTKEPITRVVEFNDTRTRTEFVPFATRREFNADLVPGAEKLVQEGVFGERTYTTKNGQEDKGVITKAPIDQVIHYNDKVRTTRVEKIPFETNRVFDATLEAGTEKEMTPGVEGIRTFTVINGKEDEGVVTTQPITRLIHFNDTTTRVEEIPFETRRVFSEQVAFGEEKEVTAGENGIRTFTRANGKEDEGVVTKVATPRVVLYNDAKVAVPPYAPIREDLPTYNWTTEKPLDSDSDQTSDLDNGKIPTIKSESKSEITAPMTTVSESSALPNTGEIDFSLIFGTAAMGILISLGLVVTHKKEND